MLTSVIPFLFASAMSLWLRFSPRSWRQMPTPGERSTATAVGPNADRLLLVGAGVSVGYGVTSGELALGGQLSRRLSAATGRGTSIDTVTRFGLRARDVRAVLLGVDLERFDALVLTVGSDEALHLVSAGRFRVELAELFEWLDANAPARFGVVIIGIPDVTSIMKLPALFERAVKRQCEVLGTVVKEVGREHGRVTYAPFIPALGNLERDDDSHVYARWADLIVPTIARVLDAHVADPRDPATIQEHRRQTALDDLGILDTDGEARYDQIVADARDLFGVQGASITFIDRDRQWSKSSVGMNPADSPRGSALGDATVQNGKLLVVEDASLEQRFAGHPWVAGSFAIRFFAGFPIEAANGERVGALCISDTEPRSFTLAEDALLGVLARRVQIELWGP